MTPVWLSQIMVIVWVVQDNGANVGVSVKGSGTVGCIVTGSVNVCADASNWTGAGGCTNTGDTDDVGFC